MDGMIKVVLFADPFSVYQAWNLDQGTVVRLTVSQASNRAPWGIFKMVLGVIGKIYIVIPIKRNIPSKQIRKDLCYLGNYLQNYK